MILRRLRLLVENRCGLTVRRLRNEDFGGQTFRLISNSILRTDYDDAWLLALSREAENFFDIGCNVGMAALVALRLGGTRQAVLVDANERALALAAENLILNDVSGNTRLFRRFVADVPDQQMRFFSVNDGEAGSMYASHAVTASACGAETQVPTTTVDALVAQTNLIPDLVKVDVEGAEGLVLQGAVATARRSRCRFFVEMHSNPDLSMRDNAERLLAWCREVGYRPWYLKQKSLLESAATISARGRCHLLLLPDEQQFPAYLKSIEQGAPLERALNS